MSARDDAPTSPRAAVARGIGGRGSRRAPDRADGLRGGPRVRARSARERPPRQGERRPGRASRAPATPSTAPAFERLDDPPIGVFLRGRPLRLGDVRVAVVGSRRPSSLGIESARTLAQGLARAGVIVVSGGAIGIDAACARWRARRRRSHNRRARLRHRRRVPVDEPRASRARSRDTARSSASTRRVRRHCRIGFRRATG